MRRVSVVGVVFLAGCASAATSTPSSATADLRTATGQSVGRAVFTPSGAGVHIVVDVHGLPPGPKGVHIHETGACTPPAFTSAGGHFNPDGRQHGSENPQGSHAGDLPNLVVAADGSGHLVVTTDRVALGSRRTSLFDADGSALIVHSGPDDLKTDPTGNSGGRIACGVITATPAASGSDSRPTPRAGY